MTEALTKGVHHVGLTVPNIDETKRFFMEVLGFQQVGEKPGYPAVFVSDGSVMLTLWQADENAAPFNRKSQIGLHHLALLVVDKETLESLHNTLVQHQQVEIEFAPEGLGQSGLKHMMCLVPGGIRLELIAA